MAKLVFTKEECLKWAEKPNVNPKSGSKININAKAGVYKELQKQCSKYIAKQKQAKEKSLSKSDKSDDDSDDKVKQINPIIDPIIYTDINNLKEFVVHTEKPYDTVNNLDEAMINACPKNVFNKAYFQYFVGQYISKRTPYKNLLLFYTVGTGKTCAAVSIAESILIGHNNFTDPPVIVILPKTLIQNFKDTIYNLHKQDVNQCTEDIYKNTITTPFNLNQLIQKRYNIMTYSGFMKFSVNNKLINKTIIIDEVHNLRNPNEVDDEGEDVDIKKIYSTVETAIKEGKNNRLILMSGTPMYNESSEIKDLLNLLLLNDNKPTIKKLTDENIATLSKNYISYINSQNPFVYPMRIQHEDASLRDSTPDGLIRIPLNKQQENSIKDENNIMNYMKYMNISYKPINCFSLAENKYTPIGNIKVLDSDNIGNNAPKIARIISYIKNTTGIAIIYSNFIEYGILQIALALEYLGYTRFVDSNATDYNLLNDKTIQRNKALRYAVITSENNAYINNVGSPKQIDNILNLVNSDDNINGEKLKIILITRKASEGLSIMNVREIHILDPWYHFNRHEQIIGRGFRRCSHIKLPLQLRNLTVFVYCGYFENTLKKSADEHAYNIAIEKLKNIKHIVSIIEENAFDNRINEKLNVFPKSLFNAVNPVNIITSQNSAREYVIGQDKEYKFNIPDNLNDNNVRQETMFLSNRYAIIIKDIMKTKDYISYDELLLKCNDKRYLDLAINKVIFPNKVGNGLLVFNNNGIQRITDVPDIMEKEIVLEEIVKEKSEIIYDDTINTFENSNYSDFELLYRFLMYINSTNIDKVVIDIIKHKDVYPKIYKVLVDFHIIVKDNYFDLFSTDKPLPLKTVDGKNIDSSKFKFEEQKVNNKDSYGIIGVAVKKKGVLDKNIIFKIVSGTNKGTKCETQNLENLNKILDGKTNSKLDKCIKIAEEFYKKGDLLIIPYIKMKK
jgi:hypothetical protein